jgi:hypothetical protein
MEHLLVLVKVVVDRRDGGGGLDRTLQTRGRGRLRCRPPLSLGADQLRRAARASAVAGHGQLAIELVCLRVQDGAENVETS